VAWNKDQIRALVEPVATDLGLEVWDVELLGGGSRCLLRVSLDRPGEARGVTIADCETVSRRLSDLLDAYDAVDGRYLLEVSSPGVNRSLRRPEHFERVVGSRVRLRLRRPQGSAGAVVGTLERVEAGMLDIVEDGGARLRLAMADVAEARMEFEFGRKEPKRRRGRKRGIRS